MEKEFEEIENKLSKSLNLTLTLPSDLREGILLTLYCAKKSVLITSLMKSLVVSHIKFKIPYKLNLGIYHYGLMAPNLHKYIKILVEEGYIEFEEKEVKTEGEKKRRYYKIADKGRKYVATRILPWEDVDKFSDDLTYILALPTDVLVSYTNFLMGTQQIGTSKETRVFRIALLEDFTNQKYIGTRSRIILFTLLTEYQVLRKIYKGSLTTAPKFDFESILPEKKVSTTFERILIKKVPSNNHSPLFELKTCVLNRFLFVLATYIVNVLDNRPITLEEIKCLTHDFYLEAQRNLLYARYLTKQQKMMYKERRRLANKRIASDLNILIKNGFINKLDDGYYVVTSQIYDDGEMKLYLPDPCWLREIYSLLKDESAFLEHRLNALERGFNEY